GGRRAGHAHLSRRGHGRHHAHPGRRAPRRRARARGRPAVCVARAACVILSAMRRLLFIALLLAACRQKSIVVGSKNFTESVLLGEIVAQRLENAGCGVERKLDLGGTLVCDKAITAESLDVYPEYSGTALTAILHHEPMRDRVAVMKRVAADYAAPG